MVDIFSEVAEFCRTDVPCAHRVPIAIVGAGAIVDTAHLPAYRAAGLDIAGITDTDQAMAEDVAARHGIPVVYPGLDALLADDRVRVVDVAVPSRAQPAIGRRVIESGRQACAPAPAGTTTVSAANPTGPRRCQADAMRGIQPCTDSCRPQSFAGPIWRQESVQRQEPVQG